MMRYSIEPRFRKYVKGYGFLSFAPKRVVQKTAEATGDLIGNKIADQITSIGKSKGKPKPKQKPEEINIPPEKRQRIIDDLKLFKKNAILLYKHGIYKNYKFA